MPRTATKKTTPHPTPAASAPALRAARPRLAALVAGAASLAVYLACLPPTVVEGDSGELVAAAHVLGIPHPTGYPLYMLLLKLADLVPLANAAVKGGVLSACFAAATAAVMTWIAATLTESAWAGLAAGLVTALNYPAWRTAVVPEVYALNALLIALAMLIFVRGVRRRAPRDLVWLAAVVGLGLAHHRTSAFFTVPLLVALAVQVRPPVRRLPAAAGALLAPLLFYLYLPLRAAARPPVLWTDATRWDDFVGHVMAREYVQYAFSRPLPEAMRLLRESVSHFTAELTVGGVLLVVIGALVLARRQRALSLCLLVSTLLLTVWNLGYGVGDIITFFVPVWLPLGLCLAAGIVALSRALRRLPTKGLQWAPALLTAAALAFVPASLVQLNWTKCNLHAAWQDYDAGRLRLARLPPNAVYVASYDDFVLLYLQQIEGLRPDVIMIRPTGSYVAGGVDLRDAEVGSALPEPVARYTERVSKVKATIGDERPALAALQFAADLAQQLHWRRPVYCGAELSQPPAGLPLEAITTSFYRVAHPPLTRLVAAPRPVAPTPLAPGLDLVGFSALPGTGLPEEMLSLHLDFRTAAPLVEPYALHLRLQPPGQTVGETTSEHMLLTYTTWLADSRVPLPAAPAGQAYRQDLPIFIPTNGPPGEWSVLAALTSKSHPLPQFQLVGAFTVRPGPRR